MGVEKEEREEEEEEEGRGKAVKESTPLCWTFSNSNIGWRGSSEKPMEILRNGNQSKRSKGERKGRQWRKRRSTRRGEPK